eukprot:jgi/Mesen1/5651/ME000286S04862
MAMAVQKLFPNARCTIGPWIAKGFYYDFDLQEPLMEKDLKKIKKEMDRIVGRNLPVRREEVSREEAERRIRAIGEPYKLEILEGITSEPITIYHLGDDWWDLCGGPHLERTGQLPRRAIELEAVAGAYWRGDEKRATLQRIYGTAWETEEQLAAYLAQKEEAKRRDHRKLGSDLNLFSIQACARTPPSSPSSLSLSRVLSARAVNRCCLLHSVMPSCLLLGGRWEGVGSDARGECERDAWQEDAGGGLVFWHPKGAMVRQIVEDYWKKRHLASGYELLYTPHIAKLDLWKTSGHYDFYKENMFDQMAVEEETYQLKPMNCPCHIMVYKAAQRSYRELPIRWGELGTVYRYERSGTMHGLFRVRGFTQDDAHIFCLPEQMRDEIRGVLDLTEAILADFGFTRLEVNLSTKPEKSVGSDDIWQRATQALREALGDKGIGCMCGQVIRASSDSASCTPIWEWPLCALPLTLTAPLVVAGVGGQVDFNLPQRFKMEYVAPDQSRQQPIMIHRAIFGSLERFFGILVENYAGDFPLWLAPVQARLLPVTDSETEYCKQAVAELQAAGVRAEVGSGERLGKLIRNAETQKIPIMAVVGPKEVESNTLTVRARKGGEIGNLSVAALIERIKEVERCKGYM